MMRLPDTRRRRRRRRRSLALQAAAASAAAAVVVVVVVVAVFSAATTTLVVAAAAWSSSPSVSFLVSSAALGSSTTTSRSRQPARRIGQSSRRYRFGQQQRQQQQQQQQQQQRRCRRFPVGSTSSSVIGGPLVTLSAAEAETETAAAAAAADSPTDVDDASDMSHGSPGIRVSATHRPDGLLTREPVCEYHEITVEPLTTTTTTSTTTLKKEEDAATTATTTATNLPPQQVISTRDLTPTLQQLIRHSQLQDGTLTVISRHTTTSIVLNEHEIRLARDVAAHLLKLAPIDERSANPLRHVGTRYLHNDIGLRPDSPEEFQRCLDNGYDVSDPDVLEQWRAQEPINAHSHLLSMLLGSSESIPIVNGTMTIGQWQSVLLVDLDGPRTRTVGVHLMGYK
jgi:thiamine phosphate synthase YjbQ (UPF0047 family)